MSSRNKCALHPERRLLGSVSCDLLLQLFPFGLLFGPKMTIMGLGEKLIEVSKGTIGGGRGMLNDPVTDHFKVRRPRGAPFTWNNVRLKIILYILY